MKEGGGKSKRWRLWRSSSGDTGGSWKGFKGGNYRAASEVGSDSSPPVVAADADAAFTAAVATVVRAPPKDFRLVKQEWAAIRIQTAFRAFLVYHLIYTIFFFYRQILVVRIVSF